MSDDELRALWRALGVGWRDRLAHWLIQQVARIARSTDHTRLVMERNRRGNEAVLQAVGCGPFGEVIRPTPRYHSKSDMGGDVRPQPGTGA